MRKPSLNLVLLLGIIAISLNLRPCITAVAPLAPGMLAVGITESRIGLLTTIPLLLFGIAGFFIGHIGARLGQAKSLALGAFIMILGISARYFGVWTAGSILIGTGIAFGNILMPGLVKAYFAERVGLVTGIYSTAINFGSAIGIAAAVPLAASLSTGWNGALGFWVFPALFALVLWIPWLRLPKPTLNTPAPVVQIFRSPRAWQIAFHLGALAWVFFSIIAWLPSILTDRGLSASSAAKWISIAQVVGCIASLTIPVIAARRRSQSAFVIASNLTIGLALAGVLLLPLAFIPAIVFLLGCGLNASFSLSLLLIAKRSATPIQAGKISALAQAIGYLVSAPGPWLTGIIADQSGNWITPTYTIIIAVVITAFTGFLAGREGTV